MEEHLSYNWNVYKIFSNGKRSKAPVAIIENEDHDTVSNSIEAALKERFGTKASKIKYKILRSDLSQFDTQESEEKKQMDLRNKVFSLKIQELCIVTNGKNIAGALLFSKDTDWSWQWCVTRAASNQFIRPISPKFKSPKEAQSWMTQEIEKIVK